MLLATVGHGLACTARPKAAQETRKDNDVSIVTFNRPEPVEPPITSVTFTVCPTTARRIAWLLGNTQGNLVDGSKLFNEITTAFNDVDLPLIGKEHFGSCSIILPEELR